MNTGPVILGVMLHAYIDVIVVFSAFYVAWMYWPGRFGYLFVFLGLSSIFRILVCVTTSVHGLMWLADAVEGIVLLLFMIWMVHFVIKHRTILLPVIKRLKSLRHSPDFPLNPKNHANKTNYQRK